DTVGGIATKIAPIVNWATATSNQPVRKTIEALTGIDARVTLPTFTNKTLCQQVNLAPCAPNTNGPAYGQKAVLFATCFGNYNNPNIGLAAIKVLAHQSVEVETVYPGCCGMPLLEKGDLAAVATQAEKISKALEQYVAKGIPVISIIPSCSLMLKSEWPLLLPQNEAVKNLSKNVMDISEYVIYLHKNFGITEGIQPLENQSVTLHLACHSRAQNIGAKAAEMLRLIPNLTVQIIERCSGHGGTWGMMKNNFETAIKVGKPAVKQAIVHDNPLVLSECPLAAKHILQGINQQAVEGKSYSTMHPIELMAKAYFGEC
ncbi:MAG: heterodisulfide reductase-related iron-sulfur binding cluster, partial [Alphaproteobacteria bacterium]